MNYYYGLCSMNHNHVYIPFKKTGANSVFGALRAARKAAQDYAPCRIKIYSEHGALLHENIERFNIVKETLKRR